MASRPNKKLAREAYQDARRIFDHPHPGATLMTNLERLREIKPLAWEETYCERGDGHSEVSGWEAENGFGAWYAIEQYFGSDSYGWQAKFDHEIIGDSDDPAKAKSIAQAHYEARIRAALSAPAQAGEVHPSHKTRYSDASSFDEVCTLCGATDEPGSYGKLSEPCAAPAPAQASAEPVGYVISDDIKDGEWLHGHWTHLWKRKPDKNSVPVYAAPAQADVVIAETQRCARVAMEGGVVNWPETVTEHDRKLVESTVTVTRKIIASAITSSSSPPAPAQGDAEATKRLKFAGDLSQQILDAADREGVDTYTKTILWSASQFIDDLIDEWRSSASEAQRLPGPDHQLDRIVIGGGEYVRWDEAVKTVMALKKELYAKSPAPEAEKLREALRLMLAHSCVADAGPDMKSEEDNAAERAARAALKEKASEAD